LSANFGQAGPPPLKARKAGRSSPRRFVVGAAQQYWDDLPRTGLALDPFVESFNGRSRDELLNVEEWVVGQFHVEK
jgi:hypothetical protein